MKYIIEQISPDMAKKLCLEIADDLPDYFGLPEVNEQYAKGMLNRLSFAAKVERQFVGLLTLEFPYTGNANIYWIGIKSAFHGKGIGTALIKEAEAYVLNHKINSLTVETLSPTEADENYLKTFRFYEQCGFQALFNLKPQNYEHPMVYMHKLVQSRKHEAAPNSKKLFAYEFRALKYEDIALIASKFAEMGWDKPASLYYEYFGEQQRNERDVWIAWKGEVFVGYVTLKWQSDYPPFQVQNIPEIKDLNVLHNFRGQGIGSKLLELAEDKAREKCQCIGISVGLTADYGNALKLYVKNGYIPDGNGITSRNKALNWGDTVKVDDDLVLWFIKRFI